MNLSWMLTGIFALIIVFELYMGFANIYSNIFNEPDAIPEGDIVRVNLKAYQTTMNYLEGLNNYEPPSTRLPRTNPFR
jgi:hypothetical protein